jgi:hypothetical protein
MASIIAISVNVDKLDKDRFAIAKNGDRYMNLMVNVNDKLDNYGNQASVTESQTKEEREAKEKRNFVGNGKIVWTNGEIEKLEAKRSQPASGGYKKPSSGFAGSKRDMDEPPF